MLALASSKERTASSSPAAAAVSTRRPGSSMDRVNSFSSREVRFSQTCNSLMPHFKLANHAAAAHAQLAVGYTGYSADSGSFISRRPCPSPYRRIHRRISAPALHCVCTDRHCLPAQVAILNAHAAYASSSACACRCCRSCAWRCSSSSALTSACTPSGIAPTAAACSNIQYAAAVRTRPGLGFDSSHAPTRPPPRRWPVDGSISNCPSIAPSAAIPSGAVGAASATCIPLVHTAPTYPRCIQQDILRLCRRSPPLRHQTRASPPPTPLADAGPTACLPEGAPRVHSRHLSRSPLPLTSPAHVHRTLRLSLLSAISIRMPRVGLATGERSAGI